MQTVIIVIHLIIVLALIAVVLLQRSEGGLGLGGGGSGGVSGFMTGRGQANALTRATAILAGLFFVTSLVLSIFATYGRAPRSILDTAAPRPGAASPQAPASQGPGVLEELQRMQGGGQAAPPAAPAPSAPTVPFQAPAAPVAPTAPATPQVPQSR